MHTNRRAFLGSLLAAALLSSCDGRGEAPSQLEKKLAADATDARPEVVFFAGHMSQGANRGACSAAGIEEHWYNDTILQLVKAKYQGPAQFVSSSANIPLEQRPAYNGNALVYVEIHHDSGQQREIDARAWKDLSGFSVFYSPDNRWSPESEKLAQAIGAAFATRGFKPSWNHAKQPEEHRVLVNKEWGVYEAPFYVIKNAQVPAVIVECGNIANPFEEKRMRDFSTQDRISDAIVEGVSLYVEGITRK